jgi:hypothetical protein
LPKHPQVQNSTAMAQSNQALSTITVEISPGELLDKISILEIKLARITDDAKLENVRYELTLLRKIWDKSVDTADAPNDLESELKAVNERLWEIEDAIRVCEADQNFGPKFVELARSVYTTNDRRAEIKRQINTRLGSSIIEEKSYTEY